MAATVQRYVSRGDFILARCANKSVLHLGCIGASGKTASDHVAAMLEGRELHALLRKGARTIVGIDNNAAAVRALNAHGFTEIIEGDVERLEAVPLTEAFDVVVCGHLLHYLSYPGLMLEGIKRFMHAGTELIITVPNAMSLRRFAGYAANRMYEGRAWVLSFSPNTLRHLLQRHGFETTNIHTCYNGPPLYPATGLRYRLGNPFFSAFPKFGGTLLVVARPSQSGH